jgi:hypothetical protein
MSETSAFATPRISLGRMIARMRDVFKKTKVLEEWPEPVCGYALREKLRRGIRHRNDRRVPRTEADQASSGAVAGRKSAVGAVKGYRRSDEALKSRIVLSGG